MGWTVLGLEVDVICNLDSLTEGFAGDYIGEYYGAY